MTARRVSHDGGALSLVARNTGPPIRDEFEARACRRSSSGRGSRPSDGVADQLEPGDFHSELTRPSLALGMESSVYTGLTVLWKREPEKKSETKQKTKHPTHTISCRITFTDPVMVIRPLVRLKRDRRERNPLPRILRLVGGGASMTFNARIMMSDS